ncbi:MAG: glycosyltransferase [Candidatus Margulisbacteria bacterium]|nr:glycosyltransferase [Candidatus Margulisiibacteriota bacterium]
MKIALVHDYLNQMGGAEKVVLEFHDIYGDAPLYTSIYDKQKMPAEFVKLDIRTSFMQKLPWVFKYFKLYLLVYPFAFRSFNLSAFDVVLSSTTAFAKGVRKRKDAKHFCYCNTPARFIWMFEHYTQRERYPAFLKALLRMITIPLCWWDLRAARDVDFFIANSKNVADRIKKIYKRDSVIIYPPVDTKKYLPIKDVKPYFLVVSRLNTYKRIDIVIEAFNELGISLKIIGDGPDRLNLEKLAKDNIEFLGRLGDKEIPQYFAGCQAFILPGEEDFGITPLEAMSCGRPVLAYGKGGALETVVDGKTGVMFHEQSKEAIIHAVKKLAGLNLDGAQIRAQAEKFDVTVFRAKIKEFLENKCQKK